MTPQEFCYWLQGFFELQGDIQVLNATQIECISRHLDLVNATTHGPVADQKVDGSTIQLRC